MSRESHSSDSHHSSDPLMCWREGGGDGCPLLRTDRKRGSLFVIQEKDLEKTRRIEEYRRDSRGCLESLKKSKGSKRLSWIYWENYARKSWERFIFWSSRIGKPKRWRKKNGMAKIPRQKLSFGSYRRQKTKGLVFFDIKIVLLLEVIFFSLERLKVNLWRLWQLWLLRKHLLPLMNV